MVGRRERAGVRRRFQRGERVSAVTDTALAGIGAVATAPLTVFDLRDSPWVDGPGRTILEIAAGLGGRGFRYLVGGMVHEGHENDYLNEARRRGLEVVPIRERGPLDRQVLRQVRDVLVRHDVAVMHTHEFRSDLIGRLCVDRRRTHLVTTAHGWIANDLKGRLYTALDKLLLRGFDRVVVVSQKMKPQLRRWGVAADRIEVVPNTLTVDDYRPDRRDNGFRRELGLGPEHVLIANIGRLSREKGQDVFLQAAAEIALAYPVARFVLIGIGPEESALRAQAASLGIGERVIFAGYRKDMKRVYNGTDLVVQSSYTEGMPNVILEALLMRVPVIATDVGGTGEIVDADRHGVLIAPGAPAALADRLRDFIGDRERYDVMARAGSERVRREFDSRQRLKHMERIYRSLRAGAVSGATAADPHTKV